jgi:hypothetical protein
MLRLPFCLLSVMISAETLQVAALVSATAREVDHVIELSAQQRAAVDCADVALLSEDSETQSTPCARRAVAARARAPRLIAVRASLLVMQTSTLRALSHRSTRHEPA